MSSKWMLRRIIGKLYISALSLSFGFFPNKLMKFAIGNATLCMWFARRITRLTIVNTTTYKFFNRHSEGINFLPGYIHSFSILWELACGFASTPQFLFLWYGLLCSFMLSCLHHVLTLWLQIDASRWVYITPSEICQKFNAHCGNVKLWRHRGPNMSRSFLMAASMWESRKSIFTWQ